MQVMRKCLTVKGSLQDIQKGGFSCHALYNNKNKKIGKSRCYVFLNDLNGWMDG